MLGFRAHKVVEENSKADSFVRVAPHNAACEAGAGAAERGAREGLEPIDFARGHAPLPQQSRPERGRVPLPVQPTGYATVRFGPTLTAKHAEAACPESQPAPGFALSEDEFNKLSQTFKKKDGKLLAMTAYGAVPVPEEVLAGIPEKIEQDPVYVEEAKFVAKPRALTRDSRDKTVQYRHRFVEIPKSVSLNRFVMNGKERVIDVKKYEYVPTVKKSKIECPLGFRYTETPLDVTMKKPAKVVPVSEKLVVKRVIRYSKPVIKQKIVEVPKYVYKDVTTPVVRKVDYYVPKYVEKVVEVKYSPGMKLPTESGEIVEKVPTEDEIKSYIEALNEQARQGIDEHVVWTADGAQLLLAPDKKTVLTPDGKVARDEYDNCIVLGEKSEPKMADSAPECYVVDDTLVVNKVDGEMQLVVGPNVKYIHVPQEMEFEIDHVELDAHNVALVEEKTPAQATRQKLCSVKPLSYVPKSLVPNLKVAPNMSSALVADDAGVFAHLDSVTDARHDETAEFIRQHRDAVFPVSLAPVHRVGKPEPRSRAVRIRDDTKVLTVLGELSPECLEAVSCGKPARCTSGPICFGAEGVPLDDARRPDAHALEEIQNAYRQRVNSGVH